ncbi:MAG TPA: hypothetical protein VM118_05740 [Acidobacteriota bacterium]|nr:hypothetical protein [Acidobacteriota bacterium]
MDRHASASLLGCVSGDDIADKAVRLPIDVDACAYVRCIGHDGVTFDVLIGRLAKQAAAMVGGIGGEHI